jgi:acyl-CoA thioester hydrolase
MAGGEPLRYELRVRYGECDPQGVVFNANYLAYFDNSINELARAACGSYQVMLDRGVDMVVAEAQLRFKAPARFDEQLEVEIGLIHLGTTSIVSEHRISRDGELLVEGTLRHVMVDPAALAKTPIPDWLREALRPWVAEGGGG